MRNIDLTGDAGVAVLVETDCLGCDFVDYFSVARIDGRWQITNKTYARPMPPPAGNRLHTERRRISGTAPAARSTARHRTAVRWP